MGVNNSALFLSFQTVKDALHDQGDHGRDFASTDSGSSWKEVEQPLAPWLVKPCINRDDASVLCFQYYLRKMPGLHSNRTAQLRGQMFRQDAQGITRQVGVMNATLHFPPSHALMPMPIGELNETTGSNFAVVTDGGALPLQDGSWMMTLYGNYAVDDDVFSGHGSSIVAVKSTDSGGSWHWLATVAHGPTAVHPCGYPSENHCVRLSNQSLYCVYRSRGQSQPLCASVSKVAASPADDGREWYNTGIPLQGHANPAVPSLPHFPFGVEPKLAKLPNGLLVLTAGRPGIWLWVATDPPTRWVSWDLTKHHNDNYPDTAHHYNLSTFDNDYGKPHTPVSQTTSYTGMAVVPGSSDIVLSYDWLDAFKCPHTICTHASAVFTVRLSVEPNTNSTASVKTSLRAKPAKTDDEGNKSIQGPVHRVTIAPGVDMPLVSNGACYFPIKESLNETEAMLRWFAQGGRGVDTAWMYNNQVVVGWALGNATETDVFVTSKVPCMGSGDATLRMVQADLRQLNVTHVDLMLIHSPGGLGCPTNHTCCTTAAEVRETWQGLERALALKLTRAIGVSNFKAADLRAVTANGSRIPSVNQCNMHVGHHDDEAIALGKQMGVTYEAYSPLGPYCAGGVNCPHVKPVLQDATVLQIAAAHNRSAAAVALRWIVQQGHAFVTASANAEYDKEDISGVFEFELSEAEMVTLSAINTTGATLSYKTDDVVDTVVAPPTATTASSSSIGDDPDGARAAALQAATMAASTNTSLTLSGTYNFSTSSFVIEGKNGLTLASTDPATAPALFVFGYKSRLHNAQAVHPGINITNSQRVSILGTVIDYFPKSRYLFCDPERRTSLCPPALAARPWCMATLVSTRCSTDTDCGVAGSSTKSAAVLITRIQELIRGNMSLHFRAPLLLPARPRARATRLVSGQPGTGERCAQ